MRTATRRVAAAATSLSLLVGLAACGGDDDGGDADSEVDQGDAAGDGTDEGDATGGSGVTMSGFAFEPAEVTVQAGAAIPISNQDSSAHTFTVTDTDVDVEVGGGESSEATAPDSAGEYDFLCRIHPTMTGTLTVE